MSTLELVQNERVSLMSVWRKLLTTPLGLLFVLLSFIAVVILLSQNAIRPLTVGLLNTAAVIVGILLTLRLTEGWMVPTTRVVKPWLGLVFWLLIGSCKSLDLALGHHPASLGDTGFGNRDCRPAQALVHRGHPLAPPVGQWGTQ